MVDYPAELVVLAMGFTGPDKARCFEVGFGWALGEGGAISLGIVFFLDFHFVCGRI